MTKAVGLPRAAEALQHIGDLKKQMSDGQAASENRGPPVVNGVQPVSQPVEPIYFSDQRTGIRKCSFRTRLFKHVRFNDQAICSFGHWTNWGEHGANNFTCPKGLERKGDHLLGL